MRVYREKRNKMSFQISLNSNTSVIHCRYHEGISLNKQPYKVGLKSFVTYNNIPNITKNNNQLVLVKKTKEDVAHYDDNISSEFTVENRRSIVVPTGTYEVHDLIKFIQSKTQGIEMKLNKNLLQVEIFSEMSDIDFNCENSIGSIFGFSKRYLEKSKLHFSDMAVKIFPINTIKVRSNLVNCNVQDGHRYDNTLYDFPLNCEVGERIIERPTSVSYYRVIPDIIYDLLLQICDQDGNLVDFRGEKISITLDFRPV